MKAWYWVLGTSLGTSLIGALGFTKGIGGLDNDSDDRWTFGTLLCYNAG